MTTHLQEPPSYPRISLLTSNRSGSTELLPTKVNSQSCSLLHFSWNSQGQTTDLDGAVNQQETQWKEMRHEDVLPLPVSPSPNPPSPSLPNTNPWWRFSALCLHPSLLHTLLPLKRAVFPTPYRLSLQLLAVCFSTWELSPRVPCPLLIHLRHTPPHPCALCCLVQLPCPQSRAQQSRVRIQQPKLCW